MLLNLLQSGTEPDTLRALLARMIRVGVVSARYPKEGAVQVDFRDAGTDGVASWKCPVLTAKTKADKAYWMPDKDERVVVLSLPQGEEFGVVVGAFYNDKDAPPVESNDKFHVKFENGTTVEVDRANNTVVVDAQGDVTIQCTGDVAVTADGAANVEAGGKATVKGGSGVDIDGGGAAGKALVYPKAISQFTGNPVQPASSTVTETQ